MSYDPQNIFAKILRGELPCSKVYEDDHALAFRDIHPHAQTHVLVIPKGAYEHFDDFLARASEAEVLGYFSAVRATAHAVGAGNGFRLITNNGKGGHQSVPHFHTHILAGPEVTPAMLAK